MFPVIFLVALTFVGPSFCSPVNPVFDLTDANFEHFLKDKDAMLVDFYAPCTREEKPDQKRKQDYSWVINCFGTGREICEKQFNVHSWPQLKVFRRGKYAGEYQGPQEKGGQGAGIDEKKNKEEKR
ncbi:Protein disulfide-isomerase A4 [Acropora cervicornis]|uniref:Protein disulfide-isomerase A4 n=1 Tax=Acropora cervicornis TaxID=6130 RepID=A0AAD9PT96_ACRCE|nr:Protein disulfide-isomerase A4 [Acropora cervicornis]